MKFVDEITLTITSGSGGDGVVRWSNSRNNPKGGPAGGDGGKGGDVRFRAVRDIEVLSKYRGDTTFTAGNGGSGGKSSLHGRDGDDVVIDVPRGSVIIIPREYGDDVFELLEEGDEVVALVGGRGGYGNEHFKSSRNVTPKESTEGKPGITTTARIELRLIADVGLVGFPNAGKSSLLNALTNARAKVGDYAFTTLDPNLGDLFGYIIADIPGIIEGAAQGRGLGHQFLRHVSRTKTLIFCISVEQDEPFSAFETLSDELREYDPALLDARCIIALTKSDTQDEATIAKLRALFESHADMVVDVTILDDTSVKHLSDTLVAFLRAGE